VLCDSCGVKPSVIIVSPANAKANNGNWHTAARWARMLARDYAVKIVERWSPERVLPDAMIALHARRSYESIVRYRKRRAEGGLLLALTGTDVYRDIHSDEHAQESLELADEMIVLQPKAIEELPEHLRWKTRVVYQSARALVPGEKSKRRFNIIQVGHLRHEKDPFTPITALRTLMDESRIRLVHVGGALDREHADTIKTVAKDEPRLNWAGAKDHLRTRRYIKRSNLLVIASKMEGGANVIVEAVTSGVPVIASKVSGNVGMLGEDYAGYFEFGNAHDCAALMQRCESDKRFFAKLASQCAKRAKLFTPEREAAGIRSAVKSVL
jgi:putative glycosyltransferase (TIGR04348 family)